MNSINATDFMAIDLVELIGKNERDSRFLELVRVHEPEECPPIAMDIPERDFLFRREGFAIQLDEAGTIGSVLIYLAPLEDFEPFGGTLPHGLTSPLNRGRARAVLGAPTKSGGGGKSILYDRVPNWDRYSFPDHSLHLQYADDDSVQRITLMTPSQTP